MVYVSLHKEPYTLTPPELIKLLQPPDSFDARPALAKLVALAHASHASDVHLSPGPTKIEVLFRCDGVLRHVFDLPTSCYERLTVGLKNLAKLVSYKKSTPQDGSLQIEGLDVRIATAPTVSGERIVLRILSQSDSVPKLGQLGFEPQELLSIESLIDRPQGLILATGPAGSGKTTSLLSMMVHLDGLRRRRLNNDTSYRSSVVTLEDPVEYVVADFHQTSIKEAMGMTFAQGVRSILRQDPELLLVGEIRDSETAKAVVQAGLSGHLVFSTIHAKDSVGVVPRLLELGVEPYQLSAALAGVVYQRLVRVLCEHCKAPAPDTETQVPVGCAKCSQSGYLGRVAIPEILFCDETIQELILQKASLQSLRQQATELGTIPLWEAAQRRVTTGLTSLAEIERIIPRA